MGNTQPREKRPRQRRRAPNLPVYVCVDVCTRVSTRVYVYVCARMGACVLKGVSHPFRDLVLAPASVSIEGGGRSSAGPRGRRAR